MCIDHLAAIDTESHLEVSCRDPLDSHGEAYDRAADKCVKSGGRPTLEETIACYRGRKVGFVNFTVDAEAQLGRMRISNEEIAEAGQANSDIMSAFGVKFQLDGGLCGGWLQAGCPAADPQGHRGPAVEARGPEPLNGRGAR